jgi:hypothetical protein
VRPIHSVAATFKDELVVWQESENDNKSSTTFSISLTNGFVVVENSKAGCARAAARNHAREARPRPRNQRFGIAGEANHHQDQTALCKGRHGFWFVVKLLHTLLFFFFFCDFFFFLVFVCTAKVLAKQLVQIRSNKARLYKTQGSMSQAQVNMTVSDDGWPIRISIDWAHCEPRLVFSMLNPTLL